MALRRIGATCCFDRGSADPAPGESWFGRVSLGESTHKRQATVKIWALRNWRRVPNPDFFRGGMAARGGVLARAATHEMLYIRGVVAFVRNRHRRTRMKLTLDLLNRSRHAPTKARESRAREAARRGRDMARTRSVHSQPKQHGSDKPEAKTLLDLHKQYIRLYYACIATRLGVDPFVHQSGRQRRAPV